MAFQGIINVAIGLTLIFFVFATLASAINEGLASVIRQRGKFLFKGIEALLNDAGHISAPPSWWKQPIKWLGHVFGGGKVGASTTMPRTPAADLLEHPLMRDLGRRPVAVGKGATRVLPSYVQPEMFATAVIDTFIQPGTDPQTGQPTGGLVTNTADADGANQFDATLNRFIAEADGDINALRATLVRWFNAQMDRVSGWYKRWAVVAVAVIALGISVFANLDVVTIARALYTDPAKQEMVVDQAHDAEQCKPTDHACIKGQLSALESVGLPLFWNTRQACEADHATHCGFAERNGLTAGWSWVRKLAGLALGAAAITLGAPFWFDLLGKLNPLRIGGPKPAPAPTDPVPA